MKFGCKIRGDQNSGPRGAAESTRRWAEMAASCRVPGYARAVKVAPEASHEAA
jgi:hypothetical protein